LSCLEFSGQPFTSTKHINFVNNTQGLHPVLHALRFSLNKGKAVWDDSIQVDAPFWQTLRNLYTGEYATSSSLWLLDGGWVITVLTRNEGGVNYYLSKFNETGAYYKPNHEYIASKFVYTNTEALYLVKGVNRHIVIRW
jgi:hypothetical protein